jgi:transcriptional regulator with XRE-family HTH domain
MTHALTPHMIRETRQAFGLSSAQFAAALGVHPTTVSRWETSPKATVAVEGTAWTVLTGLRRRLQEDAKARAEAQKQGEQIAAALLYAGALVALAALVAFAAGTKN